MLRERCSIIPGDFPGGPEGYLEVRNSKDTRHFLIALCGGRTKEYRHFRGGRSMKRRVLFRYIAGLLVPLAAIFLLPAAGNSMGSSFWTGTDLLTQLITPSVAGQLHGFLLGVAKLPAMQGSLLFNNNNPDGIYGVTIYKTGKAYGGYTLVSSIGAPTINGETVNAFLVDMSGNVVKSWSFNPIHAVGPVKMLHNGRLMGATPPKTIQGHITEKNWCGNVVWEDAALYEHHDHQVYRSPVYFTPVLNQSYGNPYASAAQLSRNKVLVLSQTHPDISLTSDICDYPLIDDSIVEVDRNGNELWRWNAWEHFDQFGFDDVAKATIKTKLITEQPETDYPEGTDWTHFNSASYLGPNKWYANGDARFHPDNIMFNSRNMNIFGIIARYDDSRGRWKSGDIIYKVGPDYSVGNAEHKLGQITGAHMVHIIPKGLPGAGNILLYNNGGPAGFGELVPGSGLGFYPNKYSDVSRVMEVNPITLDIVWEYNQVKPTADRDGDGYITGNDRKLYSMIMSGAQRLPNGNTLITEAMTGRVFEVTTDKEVVWEYMSPYTDAHPALLNANYRAYRIPYSWTPRNKSCP